MICLRRGCPEPRVEYSMFCEDHGSSHSTEVLATTRITNAAEVLQRAVDRGYVDPTNSYTG